MNFITENVNRVSSMIKSILEYSRIGTGSLVPVSVYDVLYGFDNLIGPQLRKEYVRLEKDVEENLPLVIADKVQMEEILMNFAINAMYALRNVEHKVIKLKIFRSNGKLRIEFKDNGAGIKEHLLNDIFLASVTTKGSSEGTGLGLFRTRRIVELFKGRVWADSEGKGKGSVFIVELPVFDHEKENVIENGSQNKAGGNNNA